jgi:ABC-type lipoprotein release transport system permease subunit
MLKIKNTVKRFMSDKKAEGFLDVAFKILIVVVIGAAVLLIMNTAIPGLFQGLIDKISGSLTPIACRAIPASD